MTKTSTPADLYATTLGSLQQAKSTLDSTAWKSSLAGATQQQKTDSAVEFLNLTNAIAVLSEKQLSEISEQLSAEETDIKAATDGVNAAIKTLEKIQTVLDAITKILGVAAKIVPLL